MLTKNIMKKTAGLFLVTVSAFALSACGDDAKEALGNVTEDPSLQGRFVSECGSSSILDLSERTALMFQGNEFTRTQSLFSSADCQTETAKIDYKGTFTIDPDALPESEAGSINIEVKEMKITVNDQVTADALSAINFCGVNQYPVGQEVVIAGAMSEGLCPLMNVPSNRFGAYKATDGKLTLDSDLNSMSEEEANRKATLDTSEVYTKD